MEEGTGKRRAEIVTAARTVLRGMDELAAMIREYKYLMMRALLPRGANGDMPEGWESVPLADLLEHGNGFAEGPAENQLSTESGGEGIPVINGASVSRLRFDAAACRRVPREFAEIDRYGVKACDIVMARRGPHAGACAIMPVFFSGGVLSAECCKLSPDRSKCEPFYLNNVLHHYIHTGVMDTLKISADEKEISLALLKDLVVALPSLETQRSIADSLLAVSGRIVDCEEALSRIEGLADYFS
jgi:hypothetical protein